MSTKLFVDTDVVIDFFTDMEAFANPASEIFDLNEKGEIQLYLSAVSINNIYYVVRRYLGHKKTISIVQELINITEVVPTSRKEIVQALKNNFKDFEDSIQYSSALSIKGLAAIITRNTKDYKNSQIAVFTPANYLKLRDAKTG